MINSLYKKLDSPDQGNLPFFTFFTSIWGVIIGLYVLLEQQLSVYAELIGIIPLMMLALGSIILVVDGIINFSVKYMTRGEGKRDHFLVAKLIDMDTICDFCAFQFLCVMGAVGVAIMIPLALVAVILLSSGMVSLVAMTILAILGVYLAVLKLGRFTHDVSGKLSRHVTDPNAHKEQHPPRGDEQ